MDFYRIVKVVYIKAIYELLFNLEAIGLKTKILI